LRVRVEVIREGESAVLEAVVPKDGVLGVEYAMRE